MEAMCCPFQYLTKERHGKKIPDQSHSSGKEDANYTGQECQEIPELELLACVSVERERRPRFKFCLSHVPMNIVAAVSSSLE